MLSILSSLCSTLCFWAAPDDTQIRASAPDVGAYHASVARRPVLSLDARVLLAPVERYTQSIAQDAPPWWNPAYFGRDRTGMARLEHEWQSPLLSAYHQFVAGGGENGMAITFQIDGQPACLLESRVLERLDTLIARPLAGWVEHLEMFLAWHEYGHCAYHAMRGHQKRAATRPALDAQERYRIELFADAFALTQLWERHNLDAAAMITSRRERGMALNRDVTHWTVPAVTSWREYLARGGDDHPIETLYEWVTTHDWIAIRDEELAAR